MCAMPRDRSEASPGYCAVVDHAQDDVDRIVAAWRRERPDLDVSPLEIWSRVARLSRHVDRARRQAFARSDLEPWEFDVLAALRRAGSPYRLTPGELLKETLVTSGTMTNRVDRLLTRGMVQRSAAADDRRMVPVGLTEAGRACVDDALTRLVELEQELLANLDEQVRDDLAGSLRRLLSPFEPHEQ